MYAIVEQGGRQYKVSEGDWIEVDLADVASDAKNLEMEKVLMVGDGEDIKIGSPYLDGAKVVASFEKTAEDAVVKGKKLFPTYFRKRKNSKKRIGHRQKYTRVCIDTIQA